LIVVCSWSCWTFSLLTVIVDFIKGIVSWDFDGLFMILSYSLDVRQVPHDILLLILCFHI
jgi:hypothetical protein